MNKEDISRMAFESGVRVAPISSDVDHRNVYLHDLERFAALVRADEREQCAKECDKIAHRNSGLERGVGASWCAFFIRARSSNDKP